MNAVSIQDLEALCKQCGTCCQASIPTEDGRQLVVKGLKCKYLLEKSDGSTECTTYATRFQTAPWCMSLVKAFENQAFPADGTCGYVSSPEYKGKISLSDSDYEQLEPRILKSFIENGQPVWCSDQDWLSLLRRAETISLSKSLNENGLVDVTTLFDKKA